MSSAGTILEAIKKIEQNRALARRRRALMRHLGEKPFGNLDYKSDPNRVELSKEEKLEIKKKIRKEIKWEQRRDWGFVVLLFIFFLVILWWIL